MWKMWTKRLSKLLTDDQSKIWMVIASELLECVQSEPDFLKTAITKDET